jgi:AcrR family transcriptional regulator
MIKKQSITARRGGRPSKEEAEKLEDKILDAAAALFFDHGYGATSIEQIAKDAGIAKRTLYSRFENKGAVFSAVVHRVIERVRPDNAATDGLFTQGSIEDILRRVAPMMLTASLSPQTLAMFRVVLAESARFPELALIMNEQSARQEAIRRIAHLLHDKGGLSAHDAAFAAEQFMLMVIAAPQRRALGLGKPLTQTELTGWANKTVDLFMRGCGVKK